MGSASGGLRELRRGTPLEGVHLEQEPHDDTREVFSPGYAESVDDVVTTLRYAGCSPRMTQFN
jgi:hypothetical protein